LSKISKKVIELIKENPSITRAELALLLGKSKITVYRAIKELKNKGYINNKTSNKGGIWIIKNDTDINKER